MVLRGYTLAGVLYLICSTSGTLLAQSDTATTKLNETKSDALKTYQSLRAVEKKLLKALKTSEGELARINQQINQVRIDLSEGNRRLNHLEQERQALERSLAPITQTVRTRLKARQLSLKRGEAFLRLMVQKDGPTTFLRSRGYLNAVARLDLEMLQEYQTRRRAMATNTDALSTSKKKLMKLEVILASKATQVDALSERRFALLEQAKQEKRRAERIAKANGFSSADLQDGPAHNIQLMRSQGLRFPVSGKRIRAFGAYIDPRFNTEHFSNGWHFKSAANSTVHSIEGGKVLYAGWFKGYGNLIVVEHSTRLHSVYAHLGELRVAINDAVSRDEIVALTSNEPIAKSEPMYFELRKDKVAFDPKLVLNKPR